MKKVIIAGLVAIFALGVRAAVVPGVMGDSFAEARDYVEANNVPLVLIWDNVYKGEKCEHCEALEDALNTSLANVTAVGSKVTLSEKLGTVSLPGWHYDCGCGGDDPALPFGMGTFYYTVKENGKSVKTSLPVSLGIMSVEE